MTRNDHYTWTPAPAWMQGADLIADLSTDTEDVILAFTVDTYDACEINPSFSIKIGDDWYDTKTRTPDKAITDAITTYKKQLSEQA